MGNLASTKFNPRNFSRDAQSMVRKVHKNKIAEIQNLGCPRNSQTQKICILLCCMLFQYCRMCYATRQCVPSIVFHENDVKRAFGSLHFCCTKIFVIGRWAMLECGKTTFLYICICCCILFSSSIMCDEYICTMYVCVPFVTSVGGNALLI